MADLSRSLKRHCEMDWMAISSYGSGTQSSGVVRILKDLNTDLSGRHVLVVEDIVDTLPQCALVIATSERKLWDDVHVVAVATPLDTAVELLERELGRALPPDDRVTARALCAAVDGHAATVRQLGAWLRETRRPLTELAGTIF